MPPLVWTLRLTHREGEHVSVFTTEPLARASVFDWVDNFWEQELGDRQQPEDVDDAIDEYFDELADVESYDIACTELEGWPENVEWPTSFPEV